MKSWTLLAMAMLLVIGGPTVAMADSDMQDMSQPDADSSDAMIDTPADPQVPESAVGTEAVEFAVSETEASVEDALVPAKPDIDSTPAKPLDPARPLFQAGDPGSFAFGPLGVDAEGRTGRVHTVASGDTLWDISEAYLGTPWVWPSVWNENSNIENPHLIVPSDRIWISSTEMRRVSEDEAAQLVAAAEEGEMSTPSAEPEAEAAAEVAEVVPAAMDEMPEAAPMAMAEPAAQKSYTIEWTESMGLVSKHALDAASSIVGAPSDRNWLGQRDQVYLGLGEGQVKVGDQFIIFDQIEAVRSLDTQHLLGHHINNLGWLEIQSVSAESSIGEIKESWHEIERGARVVARGSSSVTFTPMAVSGDIRGRIVHMPSMRTVMGTVDHVYLDIGALDGLEVGSMLDIITPEHQQYDTVQKTHVVIPDQSSGQLVIIATQPESAVALVSHTRDELEIGQPVRGSAGMAARMH